MQSAAEVIRELEAYYDIETLDLQIDYLQALTEARPGNARARRDLEQLIEAKRIVGLLIKHDAAAMLGASSPHAGDPEPEGSNYQHDYEAYKQRRLMIPQRGNNQQKPRRERRGSPLKAATNTQPATNTLRARKSQPARNTPPPNTEATPAVAHHASAAAPAHEPQVAAQGPRPPACQPGLLFIAGVLTHGVAAVSTSPRLRRARPAALRTRGPRSLLLAGPGGACLRAAA